MKTGLVLEGGALRGMYTAVALDVLMENDIRVDGVVGVSAGALFGVNYLSGQKGRALRYNQRFNSDKNYMGLLPLLREGNIISTEYAYERVPRKLDPFDDVSYQKSGVPFYAVVTNTQTGEPEYMQIKSVFAQMDVLRASGSMPFVSRKVDLDGKTYLDGGIADSIPFRWMANQGYEKLLVILTRDQSYRKKPMNKRLIQLFYRHEPRLAKRLVNRHAEYNQAVDTLLRWEKEGKALVVRPSAPLDIGRMETDPARMQMVYDLGRYDAREKLDAIREYLQK